VSVTVTPDPSFSPPRNRIDISAQSGRTLQTAALYRVQAGVKTLVRTQPSIGQSSAFVYDYEAPYGQPVTYESISSQVTAAGTEWSESWANTSAWTSQGGTPTVSGGKLSWTATGALTRSVLGSSAGYRVSVAGLAAGQQFALFPSGNSNGYQISVLVGSDGNSYLNLTNGNQGLGSAKVTTAATYDISVDMVGSPTTFVVTCGSVSFTVQLTSTVSLATVWVQGVKTGLWGGAVTAYAYQSSSATTYDETSSAATLSPSSGWIVHPLTPALSVPVTTSPDRTAIVLESLGDPVAKSTATVHEVLGQSLPIVSTSGPRSSDSFDAVITTATAVQEAAVVGLTRDQTPLLFQMLDPAVGLASGFYSVGDVTRARAISNASAPRRSITLPLRACQAPQGSVANPGWSWAGLAAAYSSWNAVRAAYATWAGVASNTVGS
jgi:hypothetical protein